MSLSLDVQKLRSPVPATHYDAVVVGAGPYGLSTAAHLQIRGLRVAIFGKPLNFWREHMPKDMLLRSYWWATSIADPHEQYALERYFQEISQLPFDPLPAEIFIKYGLWFQKNVVPNVDETYIVNIERKEGQFAATLADGRVVYSLTVVMAPGLGYYTYRPAEYDSLPTELVSHTSDHYAFERFAGKWVAIIGGGQSALETAALACESGANVQLVTRSPLVWIRGSGSFPEHRPLMERLRSPKAGIAPGWFNWRLEHFPYMFQRFPRSTKDKLVSGPGRYGPMGASWLKPRVLGKALIHELQCVQEVKEADDGVILTLSNNQNLKVDHVILGTGYRVDINKLPMLHPTVVSQVQTYQNAPVLSNRFESSVPGMYFVGFSAVSSCGPLYRFVVGTKSAARRVAGAVARQTAHAK